MALEIKKLRKDPENGEYISDVRLFVTADGELCTEDDPNAATLLVGEGSTLPADVAAQYGLIKGVDGPAEEDATASEGEPAEEPKARRKASLPRKRAGARSEAGCRVGTAR